MTKLFLALDKMGHDKAYRLAEELGPLYDGFKVNDFADYQGREVVSNLKHYSGGKKVWVDYKFVDTPDTITARLNRWKDSGTDVVSVYWECGLQGLQAAVKTELTIYAVCMLTSLVEADFNRMHNHDSRTLAQRMQHRAWYVAQAGVQGIVSSANEAALLACMPELTRTEIVVPGTRSVGKNTHDQMRVGTPMQAVHHGANVLVIGREVTEAKDPRAATLRIRRDIGLDT